MDSMISGAVLLAIGVLILAALMLKWRRRRLMLGELTQLPSRVTNPRLYASLKTIRAWELKSAEGARACTWARESNGQRFRTEQAIRLPIAGCGRSCQCEYLPIAEGRKHKRRHHIDAETVLNLGSTKTSDRRGGAGRRKGDKWRGDPR